MSSTSQVTTFSDLYVGRKCGRCKQICSLDAFGKHAWCRQCCRAYNKTYKRKSKQTPEQVRRANLRKNFGITPEQYDEMYVAQGGACAICRATTNFTFDNLCVDHDHTNGRVRGLLCLNCNTALGQFKDSTSLLLKAADYLEGFK